ncbi:DNA primase/polymerase, bifunctional, N-terminal [uncultured Caudovirales phage]|uniref:DNA primase/polymerase, bifunctional, N-terminal n=1 Tax=uncultured Caudovirales phage TaxID=2100421 RepID=A0A6J7WK36_9CAUD|nr:DNA primase/polymerase, bifunctional, N-terminal [uncultured Caudovirales phage]
MNYLLQAAQNYRALGLSIISTDDNKRSIFSWKDYQKNLPTDQQLEILFNHSKCKGLAVICGSVSGNLEVIDVDCKYGIDFNVFADAIKEANIDLFNRLLIVKTKSNGYHLYYKCEFIEGNQKLANRPANDDELHDNPNVKEFVLIETRGEGGYVIAPPTDGYENISGKEIPLISVDDRDLILSIARSFNQIFENQKPPHVDIDTDGLTVWDDYNDRGDIVTILEKHGWINVGQRDDRIYFKRPGATSSYSSANYHIAKRVFYCFTTSSQFQTKGYSPYAVYAILECNADYKKATKKLAELGYGEKRRFNQQPEWFWEIGRRGNIIISKYKLEKYLYNHGYGLFFHDPKTNIFRLIHEDNKKIKEVNTENIKKFIKDKIEKSTELDEDFKGQLLEVIYKNADSLFSSSFFEFLNRRDIDILKDGPNKCYFPFANGVVTIDKDQVQLIPYKLIDKSIWDTQIVDFEISIDQDFDPSLCKYYEFISKICADDQNRVNYALTLIGYILHGFKDPAKPYAPILAEETDDESKGGGTGKGIFFQAITKLIPTVRIDGKNFKVDKTFAFQRVGLGTKLVVIEDCPRNVDFEKYYPTITEGMTVEKKNKDELFLKYEESPKIAFTTNYSINNTAEHAKRRQRIFEFAAFFSSKYTPFDHFKEKLFDDWDFDEWNKFYNLMFFCVSIYLQVGIKEVDNSDKLKRKQIKLQFGEEFLEYFDSLMGDPLDNYRFIASEWKSFLEQNEIEKKEYSLKRFKKGLEMSCKIIGIDWDYRANWQNNGLKEFKIIKNSNV